MPYFIWDTPDYKDIDKKLWAVTKVATVYSTGSALFSSFANYLPASGRAFLYIYARTLIPTVAAANVGMLTAYVVAKARGDIDQHWNYLPACVAFAGTSALLRQVFNNNHHPGFRFGTTLVVMLPIILAKYGHNKRQGGFFKFSYGTTFAGDQFGNLRTYRPALENMQQDWGRRQ